MYSVIAKLRLYLLTMVTNRLVLPFLQNICTAQKFEFTNETLLQLPAGTLGKEMVNMPVGKTLVLLSYYSGHGTNPVMLLNDTTEEGKVSMQCFMPVNKPPSFTVAATAIYKMITTPGYCREFDKRHRDGARHLFIEDGSELPGFHQSPNYLFKN